MLDAHPPPRLPVMRAGSLALQAVRGLGRTRIGAVFESSFYVETPGFWVCVAARPAAMGPLTLLCAAAGGSDWRRSGLRPGTGVFATGDVLYVQPFFQFDLSAALPWTPRAAPPWTTFSVTRSLRFLRRWLRDRVDPEQGLCALLLPAADRWSAAARRAAGPAAQLGRWLSNIGLAPDAPPPSSAVAALAGLGPGLTPSGDDFLGGMLVALHTLERPAVARRLKVAMAQCGVAHDNPISAAHLEAADSGACNARIHDVFHRILAGDLRSLPSALRRIAGVGHTSGWDTLAGAVTVLDALCTGAVAALPARTRYGPRIDRIAAPANRHPGPASP